MASLDKQLFDCINSFNKIDKEIEHSLSQSTKMQTNSVTVPKSFNEPLNEETIHSKLYNESKLLEKKKNDKILNESIEFKKSNFIPKISEYPLNSPFSKNVFERLSATKQPLKKNFTANSSFIEVPGKGEKCHQKSSSMCAEALDNIQENYRVCDCSIKHKAHFSFQPNISIKSKNLSKKQGTSQERIMKKKKRYDDYIPVYFSKNRNSPYYFNDNLVDNDNGASIAPCVELYERCKENKISYFV